MAQTKYKYTHTIDKAHFSEYNGRLLWIMNCGNARCFDNQKDGVIIRIFPELPSFVFGEKPCKKSPLPQSAST